MPDCRSSSEGAARSTAGRTLAVRLQLLASGPPGANEALAEAYRAGKRPNRRIGALSDSWASSTVELGLARGVGLWESETARSGGCAQVGVERVELGGGDVAVPEHCL